MKRLTLRKSDIKDINSKLEEQYQVKDFFSKKDKIELQDDKYVLKDNKLNFFYINDQLVPSLKIVDTFPIKKVTVDMGAVKFVISGADIMRPGIVDFEQAKEHDFIVIIDQNNKKPLAIGQMLYNSEDLKDLKGGKVIKNIHRVGDELWTF